MCHKLSKLSRNIRTVTVISYKELVFYRQGEPEGSSEALLVTARALRAVISEQLVSRSEV
jgi:hypothetical protein